MASNAEVARAYYEAAERRDGAALLEILHPAVELRLTEGLPDALGVTYGGREAALGRAAGTSINSPWPVPSGSCPRRTTTWSSSGGTRAWRARRARGSRPPSPTCFDSREEVEEMGWLPDGPVRIGLTAGASTPNSQIGLAIGLILQARGDCRSLKANGEPPRGSHEATDRCRVVADGGRAICRE